MISEGQIVLFKFPQTNQDKGKLRPHLFLEGCSENTMIGSFA